MKAYIDPPKRMPLLLRIGTWIAERKIGKPLLAARILSWYPRAAMGAGIMESLVAHEEGRATARLLKLVRMQVSFMASCPFCIDMNSHEHTKLNITASEIQALQGKKELEYIDSFSREEILALRYARALTRTPIRINSSLLDEVRRIFSAREMVVIISTIAQVNFWTRMIQGIGVPPAGFSGSSQLLSIEDYQVLNRKLKLP